MRRGLGFLALFPFLLAAACGGKPDTAQEKPQAEAAVPVRAGAVAPADFTETIVCPGKTAAMSQQKVRTPFAGTLAELRVTDGDSVRRGEILGSVVARDSEAALAGAREMERGAATPGEKNDAARAVALAQKNLVRSPLRAAADGAVVSHTAAAGDRLAEDAEILTIAESGSIVFSADVPQPKLARVHASEAAAVALEGRTAPLTGVVHDILPAGSATDMTIPVRIDFRPPPPALPLGVFGQATITIGQRRGVAAVPSGAILRDDVTGVSRIALVTAQGKAHWIAIVPGLSDPARTEIVSPPLSAGQRVVVSGQVGLPEGAALSLQP
jgi:multidrug efflux pump subunit AcrA (membrane-fusion protein)